MTAIQNIPRNLDLRTQVQHTKYIKYNYLQPNTHKKSNLTENNMETFGYYINKMLHIGKQAKEKMFNMTNKE